MRIALCYPPMNLAFRGDLDVVDYWTDPRGLSGSEYGFVRLYEELKAVGHDVTVFSGEGITGQWDAAIAINDPNALRDVRAKVRVCEFWNNDFGFCKVGFEEHVDLFHSPSAAHMRHMLGQEWPVEQTMTAPKGHIRFAPEQWKVNELGCDPERFGGAEKVPGRVIYASSPDRGLHWLLQEWPAIRRAVPHAHLRVFYRLEAWIRGFDDVPYFPPIEPLRRRALYIEEALRRLRGHGVEVFDAVSRERIARELSEAEVLAYPCDTVSWSEGFSCTILEACAARACPVITDCDALGGLYGRDAAELACVLNPKNGSRGWVTAWREAVTGLLSEPVEREVFNKRAYRFAKDRTWKHTAQRLDQDIKSLLESRSLTSAGSSRTSAKSPSEASRSSSAEPERRDPTTTTGRIGIGSTW